MKMEEQLENGRTIIKTINNNMGINYYWIYVEF